MSPLDATDTSFIMAFIVFVSSRRDTASQYVKGHNISISRLRYSANDNALDSWPIRAGLASQNNELCKNRQISERGHRVATMMYSMWKTLNRINTLHYTKYTNNVIFCNII